MGPRKANVCAGAGEEVGKVSPIARQSPASRRLGGSRMVNTQGLNYRVLSRPTEEAVASARAQCMSHLAPYTHEALSAPGGHCGLGLPSRCGSRGVDFILVG